MYINIYYVYIVYIYIYVCVYMFLYLKVHVWQDIYMYPASHILPDIKIIQNLLISYITLASVFI